jgi:hypothetical protein
MVRQVRLTEKYMDGIFEKSRRVFAFGTHPLAEEVEVAGTRPTGMVTTAAAINGAEGNKIRIVIDELLVGNNIEEVACRGTVTSQSTNLARVPRGATPEDVARCALPDDVLPGTCPASNPKSICICQNPAGCIVTASGAQIAMGQPVGILDIDQDGAPDDTRMIPNAVQIKCGPGGTISVPLNLNGSYWNPSGDQNRPAIGGFEALGPAIVLLPEAALPTNVECQVAFADGSPAFMDMSSPGQALPAITDKQDQTLCTPPNGDITASCTPGDNAAFKFKVEPLVLLSDTTIFEGATGISTNISAVAGSGGMPINFIFNAPIAPASVTGITFTPALPAGTSVMVVGTGTNARTVRVSGTTPLASNTMYTATVSSSLTDTFNQPMPVQVVINFTTGT